MMTEEDLLMWIYHILQAHQIIYHLALRKINSKLEEKGFLCKGLCIYGDNAYMNCAYMATPFKAVSGGTRDC